jgi:asparagine synthase (glutamine-hydrolysing)
MSSLPANQCAPEGWAALGPMLIRRRNRPTGGFDSFVYESRGVSIILDGTITNLRELQKGSSGKGLPALIVELYEKHGPDFPNLLRGNFCGIVHDDSAKRTLAFTNHLGTRPLYYATDAKSGDMAFSTDFYSLSGLMGELKLSKAVEPSSAYALLSFGYMLDDRTLIQGAKRLRPGTSLCIGRRGVFEHRYFSYSNQERDIGEREAVEKFYDLFMQAVKRGFEKDLEYGRKHICLLSGGLDSRMIAFAAARLGYSDTLTLTFGQSASLDDQIAKDISVDLGFDHLFMPLDGGNYLLDTKTPLRNNGGLIIYAGAAHAVRAYGRMDWQSLGLLHNGNLADISHGDYVDGNAHSAPSARMWAYSTRLLHRIEDETKAVMASYPNQEAFAVNTRGINGIMNGSYSALPYTETDEPFLDIDLVRFASSLPPRFKKGERLFLLMIGDRFPEALKYPWQRWNLRPTMRNYRIASGFAFKLFKRARMELQGLLSRKKAPRFDMNPMGYWMRANPALSAGLHARYETLARESDLPGELLDDCRSLASSGNPLELCQALTLLEAEQELGLSGSGLA